MGIWTGSLDLYVLCPSPLHSAPHNPKRLPELYFWSRDPIKPQLEAPISSIPARQLADR